jgi:electron transfer flavoprotein alpha subunit
VEKNLFLAHPEPDGSLSTAALQTLSAALSLPGELLVGLAGVGAQTAADQIAGCGATRFLSVEGAEFTQARYATDAAAGEALCHASGATLILAPSTSRWARALPGVACRLGGRVDTHVMSISPDLTATRWFYRQRMEAVLTRTQRPWIVLMEPDCAPAWGGPAGTAAVERIVVEVPVTRTAVQGLVASQSDEQTIRPDAKLLFVAGAGWTKKQSDGATHTDEAEQLILGFLRAAQASLGGSKSLVDLSGEGHAVLRCMSHLNQVGQTGSTPRHAKGLSTCCHGEEPHAVGWRFVNDRRAINLDANCGWARGKADVVYIADAFEVMKIVNRLCGQP